MLIDILIVPGGFLGVGNLKIISGKAVPSLETTSLKSISGLTNSWVNRGMECGTGGSVRHHLAGIREAERLFEPEGAKVPGSIFFPI